MPLTFAQTHMLALLEERQKYFNQEDAALKDRAQKNVEAATIILGFLAVFQLSGNAPLNAVLLSAIFFIYFFVVALSVYVMTARRWRIPVLVRDTEVRQAIQLTDAVYHSWMIASHVAAITENEKFLRRNSLIVQRSLWLIATDLGLILVMVAIG